MEKIAVYRAHTGARTSARVHCFLGVVITSRKSEGREAFSSRRGCFSRKKVSVGGKRAPACTPPILAIPQNEQRGFVVHVGRRSLISLPPGPGSAYASTRPITVSCSLPLENDLSWIVLAHEIYRASLSVPRRGPGENNRPDRGACSAGSFVIKYPMNRRSRGTRGDPCHAYLSLVSVHNGPEIAPRTRSWLSSQRRRAFSSRRDGDIPGREEFIV